MKSKLPEGWTRVKVSDLGKVVTGKTPKTKDKENYSGTTPFLTPSDDMESRFVKYTDRTLSEVGVNTVKNQVIPENSICVSCIGSQLGKVVITKEDTITNQQINSIVVDGHTNYMFVYYAMLLLGDRLRYISKTSTAVPIINKSDFSKEELILPSLKEQKAIADTLSSLDDKIELNNKINENLEEQAQAIFKHWFVDFEFPDENGNPYKSSGGEMVESELGMIPKEWGVCVLDEIANITMGQSPKGTTYNELGEGVVFYQGRTDFTGRFPERRLYTTDPKRIASRGDILMSVRAPVGDINIANEDCCIGRGLCSLSSKSNMNSYLLYTLLKLKDQYNIYNGEGTVFGSINQKDLKGLKVVKPIEKLIEKYEELVSPMDSKYWVLDKENRALTEIRDTLLPKLMSGEIRIPLD